MRDVEFLGTRCLAKGCVLKPKYTITAFEDEPRGVTQPKLASLHSYL